MAATTTQHQTEAPDRGHPRFAATYDLLTRRAEQRILAPLRRSLVGAATGRVLEIGAGTGANFPYYRRADALVATEPDPYMLRRARRRAAALRVPVELLPAAAEALPFPDASFDTVVCTLVLCTVGEPRGALAEVRRVLKPTGDFRFMEHVRAEGWRGRLQDVVTPLWRQIGAGCHPNRRTEATIRAAGFAVVTLEERSLPLGMPLVCGLARPA